MTILYRQFLNDESSGGNALTSIAVEGSPLISDTYANLYMTIKFVTCSAVGHFSFDIYLDNEEDSAESNQNQLGDAVEKIAKIKRAVEIAEEELEKFIKKMTDKDGYVKFKKAKKKRRKKKQP